MPDNVLDEFLADDESFQGYTDEGANAIHQALIMAPVMLEAD